MSVLISLYVLKVNGFIIYNTARLILGIYRTSERTKLYRKQEAKDLMHIWVFFGGVGGGGGLGWELEAIVGHMALLRSLPTPEAPTNLPGIAR